MRVFIDCEWNDFNAETGLAGELISMALVCSNGDEFYEVLDCPNPTPWVAANVMPVLGKAPISKHEFQTKLATFLGKLKPFSLVADWPEDISKFCNALITGPGQRINTTMFDMRVIRLDSTSSEPHNALADARGLQEAVLNLMYV